VQKGEAKAANEDGRLPHTDKGTRVVVFGDSPKQAREVAIDWNSTDGVEQKDLPPIAPWDGLECIRTPGAGGSGHDKRPGANRGALCKAPLGKHRHRYQIRCKMITKATAAAPIKSSSQ